jgi:hypothetical protein
MCPPRSIFEGIEVERLRELPSHFLPYFSPLEIYRTDFMHQPIPKRRGCHLVPTSMTYKLSEHLSQSLLLSFYLFCAHDPTKVIVLLVGWVVAIGFHEPMLYKRLLDKR